MTALLHVTGLIRVKEAIVDLIRVREALVDEKSKDEVSGPNHW